jgi:hypothetical protein
MIQDIANFYKRNIQTFIESPQSSVDKPDYIHHIFYKHKDESKTINILLISTGNDSYHALAVSDVDKLTRYKACPKCRDYVRDVTIKKVAFDFREHVNNCKGADKTKHVVLGPSEPFVPHIQKNKTYAYLLTRRMESKFKPTRYYITFDFGTMEEPVNNNNVIANVMPLSVAVAFHSKKPIESVYYDIRDGEDFIIKGVRDMFRGAEQVAKTNRYKWCISHPRLQRHTSTGR